MTWWCTRAGRRPRPPWRGLGVRPTAELAEAAAGADVLLLCVFSDEQLTEIADPLAAALPDGAVFASHVTGRASVLPVACRPFSRHPRGGRAGQRRPWTRSPPAG